MPLNGLHPFLRNKRKQLYGVTVYCINALKRASSISTEVKAKYSNGTVNVSMPLNGLHPFLHQFNCDAYVVGECINALKRASSISTKIRCYCQS